ncbi:MAG: VWA domain-containing protein [Rhizobiaceae bacterium]
MSIRETSLPRASQALVEFVQVLRRNGFAVAPDQTISFIEAVAMLGPGSPDDIRRAGIALLAPPRERWSEYDALFNAFFLGKSVPVFAEDDSSDEAEAYDADEGSRDIEVDGDNDEAGQETSRGETLSHRQFLPRDPAEVLTQMARRLPRTLPTRSSRRWRSSRRGEGFDLRKNLRKAMQRDGEIFELARRQRRLKQRPLALLIDVSGSMKEQSEDFLRLAHTVVQSADRAEVFTLGTRLTRVTKPLRDRDRDTALGEISGLVADFDGGTRIGDALQALLAVPRFAVSLRGASVVVLSDGLERGEPDAMVDAVARMSRMAWRLDWLSPLAGSEDFKPRTAALGQSLVHLDTLAGGGSLEAVADHVLRLADPAQRRRAA